MVKSKSNAVKLDYTTVEKIKLLNIELWWVKLKTADDKINHLIWFFTNYNHFEDKLY
jgi:hypothetical protein